MRAMLDWKRDSAAAGGVRFVEREALMAKGVEKDKKHNKPKLSTKEKQQKKKAKNQPK